MTDQCPACGGVRVPFGEIYVGTDAICHCDTFRAFGTFFAAPIRTPDPQAVFGTRPNYAETVADQIITDWQSSGEVKIETLRGLIISALQDYDE